MTSRESYYLGISRIFGLRNGLGIVALSDMTRCIEHPVDRADGMSDDTVAEPEDAQQSQENQHGDDMPQMAVVGQHLLIGTYQSDLW